MKPATDVLHQVHQLQAGCRSQSALSRGEFRTRLPATYETDLTGLLVPRPVPTVQINVLGEPKFQLGQVCITPNAAQALPASEVLAALARHTAGDWGALDEHDQQENDRALAEGGRLVSVYTVSTGLKFWVITVPVLLGESMALLTETDVPMRNKIRPTHEVRLGSIKAAFWRNDTEAGVRYNVTFSRLYKEGDQWRSPSPLDAMTCCCSARWRMTPTPGSVNGARSMTIPPRPQSFRR